MLVFIKAAQLYILPIVQRTTQIILNILVNVCDNYINMSRDTRFLYTDCGFISVRLL